MQSIHVILGGATHKITTHIHTYYILYLYVFHTKSRILYKVRYEDSRLNKRTKF